MANMYLMCGCSGSGKTIFSKEFAIKNHIKYLGIDDFYKAYNGDECIRDNVFDIWINFFKAIHEAEVNNIDCIVDTDALTRCDRQQFIDWFPTFNHHLIYISCDSDLRKKNNKSRRRQVPDNEMDLMYMRLEVPYPTSESKKWKTITFIFNDNNNFTEYRQMSGDKNSWIFKD